MPTKMNQKYNPTTWDYFKAQKKELAIVIAIIVPLTTPGIGYTIAKLTGMTIGTIITFIAANIAAANIRKNAKTGIKKGNLGTEIACTGITIMILLMNMLIVQVGQM